MKNATELKRKRKPIAVTRTMTRTMIGQRMTYLVRVMTGVSMLINVVFGGNLGETVSARNWELKRNNKFNIVRLIDFVLGKDHCVISWTYYRTRKW
jgi:hypothetical protein